MSADPKSYYAVLNLNPDATTETIKQSYRELAKQWHPDHNTDDQALEKFQQLSVAYDHLSDERKRLVYDLLSLVYGPADYPDIETIEPFKDAACKANPNIRVLNLHQVQGLLWKYRVETKKFYGSQPQAVNQELKTSWRNWLLGWWHPAAFAKNIAALAANYRETNPAADNLKLLVHNAVSYAKANQPELAAQSAVLALDYAKGEQRLPLQKLLSELGVRVSRPRPWSFAPLKLVQLSFPLLLVLVLLVPAGLRLLSATDLFSFMHKEQGIDYYQQVQFKGRGQTVDDVVVGKVLNIPVDRSDVSKLYHLKSAQNVMYGPSENFDILKNLPKGTTLRLTGVSPDYVWARVMIDNGEMGYVLMKDLAKGLGNPLPDFSKVYEP